MQARKEKVVVFIHEWTQIDTNKGTHNSLMQAQTGKVVVFVYE